MRHFPDDYDRAYARGFADAQCGRPYTFGFTKHRFQTLPLLTGASLEASYRIGYIEGRAARIV